MLSKMVVICESSNGNSMWSSGSVKEIVLHLLSLVICFFLSELNVSMMFHVNFKRTRRSKRDYSFNRVNTSYLEYRQAMIEREENKTKNMLNIVQLSVCNLIKM